MRIWVLISMMAPLLATGCKSVECAEGTIEIGGMCVGTDQTISSAKCGEFTKLVGDTCTPAQDPTVCGPGTVREIDPQTRLGVCKPEAGGGGGCGAAITCPQPDTGKQTICGQLFDFETNERFEAAGALGARCAAGATAGPCALGIRAFNASTFATNPTPLAVDETYLDDCGRYRLRNITVPTGPFIALAIDDATPAMGGPPGVTNTVGVATQTAPNTAQNLDAFIAPMATTAKWAMSGGPTLATGIYAMVFRERRTGSALKAGVTVTASAGPPPNDFYFQGCSSLRTSIDPAATSTVGNGTALITNATLGPLYSGTGGLPPECVYSSHAGASIPGILLVQIARPTNAPSMTCPL